MSEVVPAFLRVEAIEQLSDTAFESVDGSFSGGAKEKQNLNQEQCTLGI
jgi:hypothetical protein